MTLVSKLAIVQPSNHSAEHNLIMIITWSKLELGHRRRWRFCEILCPWWWSVHVIPDSLSYEQATYRTCCRSCACSPSICFESWGIQLLSLAFSPHWSFDVPEALLQQVHQKSMRLNCLLNVAEPEELGAIVVRPEEGGNSRGYPSFDRGGGVRCFLPKLYWGSGLF